MQNPTPKHDCSSRHDLGVLGEFAVYPGHPVTLALVIVRTHANFSTANGKVDDGTWCHAVGCSAVPGAGGNVYAAMDLLVGWARGGSLDQLFKRADYMWEHCDSQKQGGGFQPGGVVRSTLTQRWREGQAQADRFKPQLIEALKSWSKEEG